MNCTRCETTGFLNISQVDDATLMAFDTSGDVDDILHWMIAHPGSDVAVCDCCGDGTDWYGQPGEHDPNDYGPNGPYAGNGGLPRCS